MIRIIPTVIDAWCDSAEDLKTVNVSLRRFDIVGLTAEQQDKIINRFKKDSMPCNLKSRGESFYADLSATQHKHLLDKCKVDNRNVKIVPYLTNIRGVSRTIVTLSVEFTFAYGALDKDSNAWTCGKHYYCCNLLEYVLIADYLCKTVSEFVSETNKIVAAQHKMQVMPFFKTNCDRISELINSEFCKSFIDMLNKSLNSSIGEKSSLAVYSQWRTKTDKYDFDFTAKDICTAEPAWTAINPEIFKKRLHE